MNDYVARDPGAAPDEGERPLNPLHGLVARPDDLGLAEAFEELHEDDLAWSEERGIWRVLVDGVWVEDRERLIYDAVREFARQLELFAAAVPDDGRNDWVKAVREMRKLRGRDVLIRDSKTGLARAESRYDVNALHLNLPGDELLDLDTITIATRPSGAMFTKRTGVRYRPDAKSDRFEAFLKLVQPDEEMRRYVQRCFGAGISGLPGQRLIFVLHGPSGGGKSTMTNIMSAALGSYSATIRHDALAMRSYSNTGHTSDMIPLVGARSAFVHEVPDGMALNAALLKTIVGGEEFSLSEKGKPHFTTRFHAKLYLVTNHPLTLAATDDAAWARIQMVPFEHPIPEKDRDRDAMNTLMADPEVLEAALAWAVEGWREFRRIGLAPPATAVARADEQRVRNSAIGEWLEARVRREPGAELPSALAAKDCADFLAATGSFASVDPRRFAAEMVAAGFTRRKARTGNVWVGAALIDGPAGTQDAGL